MRIVRFMCGFLLSIVLGISIFLFGDEGICIERMVPFPTLEPSKRSEACLSNSGTYVGYSTIAGIGYIDLNNPCAGEHFVQARSGAYITDFVWSNRHEDELFFLQDRNGLEAPQLCSISLGTGIVTEITPAGVGTSIVRTVETGLIIEMYLRDPGVKDLYRYDYATGELILVEENSGSILGWECYDDGYAYGAIAVLPDGRYEFLVRAAHTDNWHQYGIFEVEDGQESTIEGIVRPGLIVIQDARDTNMPRLVLYDVTTDSSQELVAAGTDKPARFSCTPEGVVEWVLYERIKPTYTFFDHHLEQLYEELGCISDGTVRIRSTRGDRMLVSYTSDVSPERYYLCTYIDDTHYTISHLFDSSPSGTAAPIPHVHAFEVEARDGLQLTCYLTMPIVRTAERVPLIVLVHGGPFGIRDRWELDDVSHINFSLTLNCAVLRVNFRGSGGFGKAFLKAGYQQWGAQMLDDLVDATYAVMNRSDIDPNRVAICGGSYGGYAAMAALAFVPELYTCGVACHGLSDLYSLMTDTFSKQWRNYYVSAMLRIGNPTTQEQMLRDRSPLNFAHQIVKPLLLIHGRHDPRSDISHSECMYQALKALGKPVQFIPLENSGHGGRGEDSQLEWDSQVAFLRTHLLGMEE